MTPQPNLLEPKAKQEEVAPQLSVDATKIQSSVLQRLIKEVKVETQNNISSYNRLHNRHNRSR